MTVSEVANTSSQFSGASWVYALSQRSAAQIAELDTIYSHRQGNLAAIDDMVASLIQKLEDRGMLDNTYIIYTTDNGTTNASSLCKLALTESQDSTLAITA